MAPTSSDERRTAAIAILLGAALFLTAVLTWQAVVAGSYHRFAAQRAIRDFAAIASDELIRRASADVEGYGFAPMRQAIATRLSSGQPMPALDQLHSGGDQRLDYSLPLVHQLFVLDVNAHAVTPSVSARLDAWMLAHLIPIARERRANGDPQSIRVDVDGTQVLISYGLLQL